MAGSLRIALAQLNLLVGDVAGQYSHACSRKRSARATAAAPSSCCSPSSRCRGYPPEDLLFHRGMRAQVEAALAELQREVDATAARGEPQPAVLIGYPEYVSTDSTGKAAPLIYNSALLVRAGVAPVNYRKSLLPNYRVFDEKRYFTAGDAAAVVDLHGVRVGLLICEDIWGPAPAAAARAAGAELLLVLNASPFERRKQREREAILAARLREVSLPAVYVNLIGGQDELVFDGNSFVMDAAGRVVMRAAAFEESLDVVTMVRDAKGAIVLDDGARVSIAPEHADEESVYRALVLGVRDYVNKHRFPGVVLGLSGGVDSALTLAIAVDALGADRVQVVMMPSRYTSQMSLDDAERQAARLGVAYNVISIEGMFAATLDALAEQFAGLAPDTTEENIQARIRGLLLMAISNKTGRMLLTTGNKSEMAVGYATLYGDMNGGFAPIKDCAKTLVYRLATLPQCARAGPRRVRRRSHSAAGPRARADGRAARQPEGHRLAAAVRGARRDARGVHRGRPVGRRDRRARLRSQRRRARARHGEAQRIQASAGAARRARQQPRVRSRLALPDHERLPPLRLHRRRVSRVSTPATTTSRGRPASRRGSSRNRPFRRSRRARRSRARDRNAPAPAMAFSTAGAPSYCSMTWRARRAAATQAPRSL